MAQQYGLGRGLASLIPPKKSSSPSSLNRSAVAQLPVAASPGATPDEVPIGQILPNPHQPRIHFDEGKLDELAASIRAHGILQPLIVSSTEHGYELIAGERRLQAAKKAGLATVPVRLRQVGEQEKLELAIIENVQRHDLSPIEEAKAFTRLMEEFGLQQDEVAMKMGKSRSSIANTVRLLSLPVEIQRAVADRRLSEGHAKALLSIENPEKQRALFDLIIKDELTVREAEGKAREVSVRGHTRVQQALVPELSAKEEWLTEQLGTKVKIQPRGKGGKIVIEYYSGDELNAVLSRLA